MPVAPPAASYEKKNTKQDYHQDVQLLPELIAIERFQKVLQSPIKLGHSAPTFLAWLKDSQIKLINIPDNEHQFWIRKQLIAK
jgi:hypothetical protein